MALMYSDLVVALDAVTANTTSSMIAVGKRRLHSIQVKAADISSGNGLFKVQVTNDNGTTWTDYKRLVSNVTNSNVQNDTKVATLTLSANGSDFLFFPSGDHFQGIRISCHRTTDGTYSAILHTVG